MCVIVLIFIFCKSDFSWISLIKRRNAEDRSVTESCNSSKSYSKLIPIVSVMKAVQWSVEPIGTVHKHQDSDLNLGFIFSGPENHPTPECVMCEEKLSNKSMVPS